MLQCFLLLSSVVWMYLRHTMHQCIYVNMACIFMLLTQVFICDTTGEDMPVSRSVLLRILWNGRIVLITSVAYCAWLMCICGSIVFVMKPAPCITLVWLLCSCGRRQHHRRTTVTCISTRHRALSTSRLWCQRITCHKSMYARVTSGIASTATVCWHFFFSYACHEP